MTQGTGDRSGSGAGPGGGAGARSPRAGRADPGDLHARLDEVEHRLFERTAELAATSRQLAREMAERRQVVTDKARVLAQLEEAVRFREEFLALASHELKTPVTALQLQLGAAVALLERGIEAPGASERLAARVRIAERQADRLGRLVDGLLDVTRLAAGEVELELAEVDVRVVIADVASRLSEDTRRSQTPVALDLGDRPLSGRWDRLRLEQMFTTLLSNALKFGAHKPIEVAAEADDGEVRVRVRDQGIGVAPEDHERIFRRFGRAVSERHYGGFGLGLWMARQSARALGGEISVESQPGQGATFTVRLPRSGPRSEPRQR